jgi:hypothetical protein
MSPTSIDSLFVAREAPELGPQARPGVRSMAEAEAHLAEVCGDRPLAGKNRDCLRALVLLWNDHLDEAHRLVQDLPGPDPAFVHGIVHRREPDYANARYWFQRVSQHPILEPLAEAAAPILAAHAALPYRLIREGRWDPFAFIDAVMAASTRGNSAADAGLLRELQRQEIMVLARHLAPA